MSKMREKESLERVRMYIWALKTQKLPGPRPQIARFTHGTPLRYVGNFRPQKLAPPPDQILDPHLSEFRMFMMMEVKIKPFCFDVLLP